MTEEIDWHAELTKDFEANIKGKWFPLSKDADNARGYLFETLLGKTLDNKQMPDFGDIEIKTKKQSSSAMTLFTKSPQNADGIRTKYGRDAVNSDGIEYKRLNSTFTANAFTNSKVNEYDFKVKVDREERKVKVVVSDKNGNIVSDGESFWTFEDLQNTVVGKLAKVAVVAAETRTVDGQLEVSYPEFNLYEGFTFDKFLKSLEDGALAIDIRMGQYGEGPKKGQLHDHGTAFRLRQADFIAYATGKEASVARKTYVPHETARELKKMQTKISKVLSGTRGGAACTVCGRPLRSAISIARGAGAECLKRK